VPPNFLDHFTKKKRPSFLTASFDEIKIRKFIS